MARTTKLTPALKKQILAAIRAGNTRTAAAEYVGIPRQTLWVWAKDNATFHDELLQAEAQAEIRIATKLVRAIDEGDTAAARWWLERRRPEDWRKREELQLTGGGSQSNPVRIEVVDYRAAIAPLGPETGQSS